MKRTKEDEGREKGERAAKKNKIKAYTGERRGRDTAVLRAYRLEGSADVGSCFFSVETNGGFMILFQLSAISHHLVAS